MSEQATEMPNVQKHCTLKINFKQCKLIGMKLAATAVNLASKIDMQNPIDVLTRSGHTANLISRAKPTVPVFAFSNRL